MLQPCSLVSELTTAHHESCEHDLLQIVQCLGAVIDRKNLLLIMELMPRGDLYRNLQRDREGVLRWQRR